MFVVVHSSRWGRCIGRWKQMSVWVLLVEVFWVCIVLGIVWDLAHFLDQRKGGLLVVEGDF